MNLSQTVLQELKEYDQRQLNLMLQKLLLYKHDEASLYDVGVNVMAVGWLLNEDDDIWKEEVERHGNRVWGIYDRLCWDPPYNELTEITPEEKIEIEDAVCQLIILVKSKMTDEDA